MSYDRHRLNQVFDIVKTLQNTGQIDYMSPEMTEKVLRLVNQGTKAQKEGIKENINKEINSIPNKDLYLRFRAVDLDDEEFKEGISIMYDE